jgi:hypothetical protein
MVLVVAAVAMVVVGGGKWRPFIIYTHNLTPLDSRLPSSSFICTH